VRVRVTFTGGGFQGNLATACTQKQALKQLTWVREYERGDFFLHRPPVTSAGSAQHFCDVKIASILFRCVAHAVGKLASSVVVEENTRPKLDPRARKLSFHPFVKAMNIYGFFLLEIYTRK